MTNLSPSGPWAKKGKEPGHTDHLNKPGGFFSRKLRSWGDHRETPASEPAKCPVKHVKIRWSPQICTRDADCTWLLLGFRTERLPWNWGQIWSHGKSKSHISYSYGWGDNQKKVKEGNKAIVNRHCAGGERKRERERDKQTNGLSTLLPAPVMRWILGILLHPCKAGVGLGSLQLFRPVVLTFVECLLWARPCSKPFSFINLFNLLKTLWGTDYSFVLFCILLISELSQREGSLFAQETQFISVDLVENNLFLQKVEISVLFNKHKCLMYASQALC